MRALILVDMRYAGRGTYITSLRRLAELLFPDAPRRQELFVHVVHFVANRPATLNMLKAEFADAYSGSVLAGVWKQCLALGVLERPRRGRPARLSTRFSRVLRKYADFWESWVRENVKEVEEGEW